MNKRLLSILFVLAICVSLAGTFTVAAAEEPVELTIAVRKRSYDSTKSFSEKHWVQEAEAACNVKINWIELMEDSMSEQLSAVLAGDLPDAFLCGADMSDSLISQNTNLWHALTLDEIKEYAPTYYNVCETYIDGWQDFVTYPDGNIYSLMGSIYDSERHYASGVLFMNHQWLDDLGMAVPTNLDELHEYLVAIRDNDMNGNGDPSDEYPINFCNNFYASQVISFAAWWGLPVSDSIFYKIEDGNVVNAVDTQAFREFLEYFYQLGQEGLLNLEGFSSTSDQFTSECDAMKAGIFGAWAPSYFIMDTNNAIQYVGMPAMAAEGYTECNYHSPYNHANRNAYVISRDCKNVEAALRFYDYLSDPTRSIECFLGEEGIFWEFIDDDYHFTMVYCPDEETDPDGYAAHVQKLIDAGYESYVNDGVILDGSNLNYYNTAGCVDASSLVLHAQSYDMTNIADGNVVRVQAIIILNAEKPEDSFQRMLKDFAVKAHAELYLGASEGAFMGIGGLHTALLHARRARIAHLLDEQDRVVRYSPAFGRSEHPAWNISDQRLSAPQERQNVLGRLLKLFESKEEFAKEIAALSPCEFESMYLGVLAIIHRCPIEAERDCTEHLRPLVGFGTMEEVRSYLQDTLSRICQSDFRKAESQSVQKAAAYIREHYAEPISVKMLADQCYMNYTYFSELFKKETGISITQYIMDIRMSHAMQLLRERSFSLEDVALAVGYGNAKSFSQAFRNYFGVSPKKYTGNH